MRSRTRPLELTHVTRPWLGIYDHTCDACNGELGNTCVIVCIGAQPPDAKELAAQSNLVV